MDYEELQNEIEEVTIELQGVERQYDNCGCDFLYDEIKDLKQKLITLEKLAKR